MKKIKIGALCLLLFPLLFSCTKSTSPEPVAPKGKLIATVGNTAWESGDAYAVVSTLQITLMAQNSKGSSIQLEFPNSSDIVTYGVTGTDVFPPIATVTMTQDGEDSYKSTNYYGGMQVGTITIIEIDQMDKTISGKFSVKVKRLLPTEKEVILKSGSFTKIPYFTSTPQTFSATVGGVPFSAPIISGTNSLGSITLNFAKSGLPAQIINIVVPDNATTGAHTVGDIGTPYYGTYTQNGSTDAFKSGTITITSHNTTTKRIVGTFNCSSGGSLTAAIQGSFAVSYN